MWYSIFAALVGVLIATLLGLRGRRTRMLANRIPGTDGSFIVGSLPLALQGPESLIKNALKLYRGYENTLFKAWLFNHLLIILTKPEDIESVLTNPKFLKKAKEYSVFRESIMGQGIFSIDDITKWRNNRKMVVKGFSLTLLKTFIPIFFEEANVLVEILEEKRDLKTNNCDISVPISMATMEMIGKTALGVTFDSQWGGSNRFVENLQTVMHTWEYRLTHPWYLNKTLFHFSPVKRKHDRSQKIINDFTDKIIKSKMVELNRNESAYEMNIKTHGEDFCRKNQTVVEILLQSSNKMSHEQIRDEIITILIGGQETTSMAIACVVFMLSHHQCVQNKVFEELQSIFSSDDRDRPPALEDLQQMKYLERVIKETLRLYPSVPVFAKTFDEDMDIGGHLCPAGSAVIICPLFVQSSPLYYADPDKFDPDNFLPDACASRHPYEWIPFSAGLRNCIGIKYAMIQMKTVVSTLVRKLEFSPSDRCPAPENLRLMFLTTLKLVDGCHVKIEQRT